MKWMSRSLEDTEAIGKELAKKLSAGAILCLTGDLGAGKTSLSKSIGRALGIKEDMTSPTYTIVNEYPGDPVVYHFDVYRIDDPDELEEIGFDDYIFSSAISLIEWADKIKDLIPKDALWVSITYGEGPEDRLIQLGDEPY